MLLFTQLQKFNETKNFLCGDLRGGGGGHSPQIWKVCAVAKWKMGGSGAARVENEGLWSEIESENAGLRNWLCRMRLAGTLAGR